MKTILKFAGPIIVLIGVLILTFYFFAQSSSNTLLVSGGIVMALGLVLHIILNKQLN
jgi:uncharacterized protein YjeT (DUF2065 family)